MAETTTSTGRTFLEDLSQDLTTLAALLTGYAEKDAAKREAAARRRVTAGQVRAVAAAHYARSEVFGMDLGNPGWNLLLQLYHAFLHEGPVRLPRLARDARVSATTAARWLDAFTRAGFVRRAPDPERQGTVTFALTLAGAKAMEQFFVAIMLIRDAGDTP